MKILIVVQDTELANQIARSLARAGSNPKIVPSVSSREFLTEFSDSALVITDLSPPVLRLLSIEGRSLLGSGVPVVLLATQGHVAAFAAWLPVGSGECVASNGDGSVCDRILAAVERCARSGRIESQREGTDPGVVIGKRITADQAHTGPSQRFARGSRKRQVQLVSNIAHDLRTPLTAIHEFAHLIGSGISGRVSDQQRRYASIIERRCAEAARMVDNMLDGARLQAGRVHPHRQAVDLSEVFRDVKDGLEPVLQHSQISFVSNVPDGLLPVFADRDMLVRIVTNLVSNAIKFSSARARVIVSGERQSVRMARVSVTDTGCGITPEDLRRIFRRFEQGSNRTANGVGLGLAIVRELVKLHGGRVMVESTVGKGSRFQFTIPHFLPGALLKSYIARCAERKRTLSYFGFRCTDLTRVAAVHRLLSASIRSRDLVLPTDDTRLLLATQSKQPQRLVDRILGQIASLGVETPLVESLKSDELSDWLHGKSAETIRRSASKGRASRAG